MAFALSLACAPAGQAASRKPLPRALSTLSTLDLPATAPSAVASSTPEPQAGDVTDSASYAEYPAGPGYTVRAASSAYDAAQIQSVVDVLGSLHHGPELSQLSVYVATPQEIAGICGSTVLACYLPGPQRMVISGVDRPVDGVPRDFAIAHEYGHHIANNRSGAAYPAIEAGTIRWATYERVCQFSRARKLFPGDQGAHYFEDPEEAFAESYAHLTKPGARVSWQYSSLLRPTRASLAKIRADVSRPWNGPVTQTWNGSIRSTPATMPRARMRRVGRVGLGGAQIVGLKPWEAIRRVRTPLDGTVEVSVTAPAGADYAVALRDARTNRVLSRASTGDGGTAGVSYGNCGHGALRVQVRSLYGNGPFTASIVRP